MKIKKEISLASIFLAFMLSVGMASAFGVATPYWDDNPLRMYPGESAEVTLNLQNMVGSEDVTLSAEFTKDGNGIATFVGGLEYLVPFGRDDVPVLISIDVPETDTVGGTRYIELAFSQVSTDNGGMVSVVGGFNTKFPVYVVAEEESTFYLAPPVEEESGEEKDRGVWYLVGAIVIIIIVILWILLRRRRKGCSILMVQGLGQLMLQ